MSSRSIPFSSGRAGFACVAGLVGLAAALFAPQLFNDADTYWHIRAGEWMLNHDAILRSDPFSYTMADKPWNAQEWLAEIAMALAWRADAWNGLHILFGLATGATCFIMASELRRRMDAASAVLACVMGLACVVGSLLARPHLLALPLLAAWSVGLIRARDEDRAPSFWLLLLIPLWANLHGSFMFGLALAAALGVEAVAESATRRLAAARDWALFVVAGCVAAMITPQGLDGLLFPLHLMAMSGLAYIGEWHPTSFATVTPFEIALLAAIFVVATRGIRLSPIRAAIVLGLLYMALAHARHQMLLGISGTLLLAKAFSRTDGALPDAERHAPIIALCVSIAFLALLSLRFVLPTTRSNDWTSPIAALVSVPAPLRQTPVLNDYSFGGYLIFEGVKPYIDSRADLYGDRFLDNYGTIIAPDRAALAATLIRYRIRWTMLAARSPLVAVMDTLPGWRRVHTDDVAVVHVDDERRPIHAN
jgi:hypothetical protein